MKKLFLLLIILLTGAHSFAQMRGKWVYPTRSPIVLDSLAVTPYSISISPPNVPFSFSPKDNALSFPQNQSIYLPDSVWVSYRVLPFAFHQPFALRIPPTSDSLFYQQYYQQIPLSGPSLERESLLSTPGITKTGSITRAVASGNNQSTFVQSAMNLQLEGQLTNDLFLTAILTDQQVPYQPEGNTQRIQDFDRILVELRHRNGSLQAGDIVLESQTSEFLKYRRQVQGTELQVHFEDTAKKIRQKTTIGGAITKGQFFQYQIPVLDGISGPYRINGPNNERFLIIIANSEKVYLDGKLLARGFQNGYTIDYNTAEITFMPNVLITRFSRVWVTFEYSVQAYNRSAILASHTQRIGIVENVLQVYQERDQPNRPLFFTLDEATKALLSSAGDAPINAPSLAIREVNNYSPDAILYVLKDTISQSGASQIYVRAAPQDPPPFYQVNFVEVPDGQGNYLLGPPTSNGRSYIWVAPQNGVPQGKYEPGRTLSAPTLKRMYANHTRVHVGKSDYFFGEIAVSTFDKNLFSELDRADDLGTAYKVGYRNQGRPFNGLSGYQWLGGIEWESNSQHFNGIDLFREVEFNRDWTLAPSPPAHEQLLTAQLGIQKSANQQIIWKAQWRNRIAQLQGQQHQVITRQVWKKWHIKSDFFWMKSQLSVQRSEWIRGRVDISYRHAKWVPGYQYQVDRHTQAVALTDSITFSSMNFREHRWYLTSGDSTKRSFQVDYAIREDLVPQQGEMKRGMTAETWSANWQQQARNLNLSGTISYRKTFAIADELIGVSQNRKEEHIVGRLNWKQNAWKKHAQSELTLTTSSGRELKREFLFIQVENGLGTHTWRDDNQNGLQELSEFYLAYNPDEKNYAKFFTPTTEYVPAYLSNFNYRLQLDGPSGWLTAGGWKKHIARLSGIGFWSAQVRTTSPNRAFTLANLPADSPEILSYQNLTRYNLYYHRKNPVYGLEFRYQANAYQSLLTGGFESRANKENAIIYRWNPLPKIQHRLEAVMGIRENASDFMENRNFAFRFWELKPEWTFQPSGKQRVTLQYVYKVKKSDTNEIAETARFQEYQLSGRLNPKETQSFMAQLRFARIQFAGEENTPLGYELLEGLRKGNNFTWSGNWTHRLANGLQLLVSYQGRRSPGLSTIHTGRVQVTALF